MGGSSYKSPKPSVPPPKEEDKAVQEAAAEAARRRHMGTGYRSTILGSLMDGGAKKATMGS